MLDEGEKYSLGLINLETYNSFPNVDSSNNRFHFTSQTGKKDYIEIPEGSYEIDDICLYLNKALAQYTQNERKHLLEVQNMVNNIKLRTPVLIMKGNNNTLKSEVKCTLDIDFSQKNSIGSLLGFHSEKLLANKIHVSHFPAKILKINALCVECNIVTGSFRNGKQVHVIHEFFPNMPPGYKIIETPSNVIYLPIIDKRQISEIVLKITDQDGNIVNFRGEVITIRLHLQKQL